MALDIGDFYHNIYIETKQHYDTNESLLKNVNDISVDSMLDRCLLLPIAPEECMFNTSSTPQTLTLLNTGDVTLGTERKLATWTVTSLFPSANNSNSPVVIKSNGNVPAPYDYFCATLYWWKEEQTPLIFRLKTWGNYYACLIQDFKFGVKDDTGDVWYQISFVEYRECNLYGTNTSGAYVPPVYKYNNYQATELDDIMTICQNVYGTTDAYRYFMKINGMTNIEIEPYKWYVVQ